jgi:transposase
MNFERFFADDIREKKKIGSGAFHRRGKGVKHGIGSFRFTFENMSRKEKREYTKPSEVRVTNMFDNVLPRAEFEELTNEQQKNALVMWRDKYNTKEIQKGMGIASATYYNYVDKFDLPKLPRGTASHKKKKEKTNVNQTVNVIQQAPQTAPVSLNGVNYNLNGVYTVEEIQSKIEKLALLLEGEKSKFQIKIDVNEV